jgi:hypothetical protein
MQTATEQFILEITGNPKNKFKNRYFDIDKTKDLMQQLDKVTTPEKMNNTGGGTPVL